MPEMQSFMGVNEGNGGIIGKLLYYSTSNILIPKNTFVQLGKAFNLPKVKPARESKSSAYRYATTALKERVVTKDLSGTHIYRIYCRDNKQDTSAVICRELVKETMNATTNSYKKLANIAFKRETEEMYYDNLADDADVNAEDYCQQALTLFEKFRNCYNSNHVDSVVQYLLDKMQAVKINIHGNLYFIPSTHLPLLNVLEDYIEALSKNNINDGNISSNSMFVADDEKQREKMAAEFYMNYRRDIEAYEERIQHFIDSGCDSAAVIERWLKKIEALKLKKATYEQVLKRQLDDLDRDFALLQMQSQELSVRAGKNQIKMPLAA